MVPQDCCAQSQIHKLLNLGRGSTSRDGNKTSPFLLLQIVVQLSVVSTEWEEAELPSLHCVWEGGRVKGEHGGGKDVQV